MKYFKKDSWSLAAMLLVVTVALGFASGAGVTNFKKVQLDSNAILDSNGTQRISVGSTNAITGNVSISGTLAVTGATTQTGALTVATMTVTTAATLVIYTSTAPRSATVGITPAAAGQLVYNSTDLELCMSTGSTSATWVEVSSGTAFSACKH